jgi:DNA-binding MarR family transcriptional regulator
MVELLFFAYRDFTGEADVILGELGFGRAHHRVLHFVNRNPGLRVADLLDVLRITKQSLSRVLKQLVDEGFVAQERPLSDRRERRLHLTEKGAALADRLLTLQTGRISEALGDMSAENRQAAQRFLLAIVGDEDRDDVWRMISRSPATATRAARERP